MIWFVKFKRKLVSMPPDHVLQFLLWLSLYGLYFLETRNCQVDFDGVFHKTFIGNVGVK